MLRARPWLLWPLMMLWTVVMACSGGGFEDQLTGESGLTASYVAIDSGGAAAGSFLADTDFSGGNTNATSTTIDTSAVTNPAPQAVYRSERWGVFSYTIEGLAAGAPYTVRLHFAEIHFSSAGQRAFNVSINGAAVLTNFDIVAAAGAPNKAVVKQFAVTAGASGQITIAYTQGSANWPKSSGIEIEAASTTAGLAIDSGGAAAGSLLADKDFSGGNTNATSTTIDTSAVANPAPQAVYQSERWGVFSYTITGLTAGAPYTVRLHLAEIHFTSAGQRVFNVSINGAAALTNFDIVATAGAANKAVVKQFAATASASGQITIDYTQGSANWPKSSGIEIVPAASSQPADGGADAPGSGTDSGSSSGSDSGSGSGGDSGSTHPTAQFGLDINSLSDGWPSAPVKVGVLRLWDDGLRWDALQPTCGALDPTLLTTLGSWLDLAASNGAKVNYTIGHVPSCAGGGNVTPAAATSFLTLLGKYSAGRKGSGKPGIDYYELMNEPNNSASGGGGDIASPAVLAKFMQAAYKAIRANDPSAIVVSPSAAYTALAGWPDSTPWGATGDYLQAAQALGDPDYPFFDYQAYHYYLAAYSTSVQPEGVVSGIAHMRAVMSTYGVSAKPLVNTEFSWGNSSPTTAADLAYQSNFLARSYALFLANDADMWWYGWGFTGYGCLWASSGGVRPAGVAYEQVSSWLSGAKVAPATVSGTVYTVPATLAGSQQALVVWDTAGGSTFSVPAQFQGKSYRTITGASGVLGATIAIGETPIFMSE